ncbi:MAG: metal-dependent hydrolase [Archaeoglobaceae archaeon]
MDTLSHVFVPLTALYLIKGKLSPSYLLAFFAIFPDLDKLLRIPGLFHSLLTLIPLTASILFIEKHFRGSIKYSGLISFFIFSHLLLDLLDGGPVALLYPASKIGVGLEFPMRLVLGKGISIEGDAVRVVYSDPRISDSYEIFSGFGVVSAILFAIVCLSSWRKSRS